MTRSRRAAGLLSAALLAAAPLFASVAGDHDAVYLREAILRGNDPRVAASFLGGVPRQEALKAADPALYLDVFQRAAELVDLEGVFGGASSARSIRLSLLERTGCTFCLDADMLSSWVRKHLSYLGPEKFTELDSALWGWGTLDSEPKAWLVKERKDSGWAKMSFPDRHQLMRRWALGERTALLKLNPGDKESVVYFLSRAYQVREVLGDHEMTELWQRWEAADKASKYKAIARARGAGADPRQQALLARCEFAADPQECLSALVQFFDNLGEHPRELQEAAPPRPGQRFDGESRRVVSDMLKTALLKETEGTFAGKDLAAFYSRNPLEVRISTTSLSALGWYMDGNALFFNERYVEQYVKSRGKMVDDLKRDPALLQDLARTLVATFVHEAQHHRQEVWALDNDLPRRYHQGDEVEAFQVEALFLLEKMKTDPKFRAFAEAEGEHSTVLKEDLGRARRMEEEGPDYFAWTVPNTYYAQTLSNEGNAWGPEGIGRLSVVARLIGAELARRESLPAAERGRLDRAPPFEKEKQRTAKQIDAALLVSGSDSLRDVLADVREAAAEAAKLYSLLRRRQEAEAQITMERYKIIDSGSDRAKAEVPSPSGQDGGGE